MTDQHEAGSSKRLWLEETLQDDLKWCFSVKSILHTGKSKFQDVELVETGPFGKVLLLDGKLQSAESDEKVYHECLVQLAMLHHPSPKQVYICGGGEGATLREVLRNKVVEKCVMVDIDQVVVDFCKAHLTDNTDAFNDKRTDLIVDDARAILEKAPDASFDIIVGDLADPVYGGPCYQLYTQEFYENVVKRKLKPDGIFVTQSGPCGHSSHTEVYTTIHNTLRTVFAKVVPYAAHVPSFADTWGWQLCFTEGALAAAKANGGDPLLTQDKLDALIAERFGPDGLSFLDGRTIHGVASLNKGVRKSLENETSIYTVDNPVFIHGSGIKTLV